MGVDACGGTTHALLDQGSEASFIHTSLARRLNFSKLSLKLLTGTTSIQVEKVDLILESIDERFSKLKTQDIVTDKLDVKVKVVPRNEYVLPWKQLLNINFPQGG